MVRGEFAGKPTPKTACCACHKDAVAQVRVAWDYMRGNDDWEPVCLRHLGMAKGDKPGRFIAHMLTKDKFTPEKA